MASKVTFSGGKKIQALFKNAGKGGVESVDVGVFSSAKYPDGTSVAMVAAVQEFGSSKNNIPERPAIRNANKGNEDNLIRIIKKNIDPEKMIIDVATAEKVGISHQGATQKSIIDLRDPPNAPSTLSKKVPQTNPLIESGKYSGSITYKVNK